MKNAPQKLFGLAYAVNYISQAIFCMICPAGLIIFLGVYIQKKTGAGGWLTAVSIVVGVLVGFYCMIHCLIKSAYMLELAQKNKHSEKSEGNSGASDKNRKDVSSEKADLSDSRDADRSENDDGGGGFYDENK